MLRLLIAVALLLFGSVSPSSGQNYNLGGGGAVGLTDAELRATPVPVSGTVTATGPLTDAQLRAVAVPVSGTVTATGPLTDAQLRATPVPVSGTVTTTPPANASTNLAQVAGTATVTGGIVGSQGVGGVSANNTAITQNPMLGGAEVLSQGTQPTAATTGNQRRILASVEGAQFIQHGNSNRFSCFVQAVTATTQCQAAPGAGLRAYITSVTLSNIAATVQTLDVIFGTGVNCATAPTALTHKLQFGTLSTTTNFQYAHMSLPTPLIPTAATALCIRPSAATSFGGTITGFIAP